MLDIYVGVDGIELFKHLCSINFRFGYHCKSRILDIPFSIFKLGNNFFTEAQLYSLMLTNPIFVFLVRDIKA